jgi:hypothetical protein
MKTEKIMNKTTIKIEAKFLNHRLVQEYDKEQLKYRYIQDIIAREARNEAHITIRHFIAIEMAYDLFKMLNRNKPGLFFTKNV